MCALSHSSMTATASLAIYYKNINLSTETKTELLIWFGECGTSELKYLSYNFCIKVLMSAGFCGIPSGNNKKMLNFIMLFLSGIPPQGTT